MPIIARDDNLIKVGITGRCTMAKKTGQVFVKCKIERSPFSDERIFSLALPDDSEHIGAASYIYLTDSKGRRLKEDEPARGKSIQGWVQAILIREEGDTFLVSFPDGSVVSVAKGAVKVGKEAPDVPVQP
jgi:hypothetical protein